MAARGLLLLNTRAGSVTAADSALRDAARDAGLRVVDITPALNIREEVRRTLDAGLNTVIVAGGDGSIHHAAQALVGTEGILGIIPVGTINHFARDLGIPVDDWGAALEIALGGEVRQIDTGRVNGRTFLNSVMLGVYPTLTQYRESFRSTHSKWQAYAKATRLALHQFHHVSLVVEIDSRVEVIRTPMFVVSINSYDLTSSGIVALKKSLDDGRLTIYSLSFMERMSFIRAAAKYLRGRIDEVDGFRSMRTTQLRVDSARKLHVSVDGEVETVRGPLQIAAVPASLLVRAPG